MLARKVSRVLPLRSQVSVTPIRTYAIGPATVPPAKVKYVPTSGEYPQGYRVGGIHCGIKKDGKSLDLALVTSELPASAAAVFTKNVFKAAPVLVSRDMLAKRGGKGIRALIANSGCANAVTGKGGLEDAEGMGKCVDGLVGETEPSTVVMSTGVIGQRYVIVTVELWYKGTDNLGIGYQSQRSMKGSRRHISFLERTTTPGCPLPKPFARPIHSLSSYLGNSRSVTPPIELLVWRRVRE